MQHCPKCRSADVHCSRSRSQWERFRQRITEKRPYRCRKCNWRGWRPEGGPTFGAIETEEAAKAVAAEDLDLTHLDGLDMTAKKRHS